jgi:hypothetical protein
MKKVIDLEEGRRVRAVRRGYRNWSSRFKEPFGMKTRLSQISLKTLSYLAQGKDKGTFYLYDLIMNVKDLGSGFEFEELSPKKKMAVIDHYLFLLDLIRFECMKRLGWLDRYPGEDIPLVEFITQFDKIAPGLRAQVPVLNDRYPGYERYLAMNTFDKEAFVRKLIPKALKEIQGYSSTL